MRIRTYDFKGFVKAVNSQASKRRGYPLRREEKADLAARFQYDWNEYDSGTVRLALILLEISEYPQREVKLNQLSPWIPFHGDPDNGIIRKALGLSTPIALERLDEFLDQLSDVGSSTDIALYYPMGVLKTKGVKLWLIGLKRFPYTAKLRILEDFTKIQARVYGFHPALILASILCDTDIEPDEIVMFKYRDKINIEVASIDTSTAKIVQAYSEARKLLKGKHRKTGLRERSVYLCVFMDQNPNLHWSQRLRRWNEENPNWQYSDINCIQAAYSRVKPLWENTKRFVHERKSV